MLGKRREVGDVSSRVLEMDITAICMPDPSGVTEFSVNRPGIMHTTCKANIAGAQFVVEAVCRTEASATGRGSMQN
jgi:hypothetical protein